MYSYTYIDALVWNEYLPDFFWTYPHIDPRKLAHAHGKNLLVLSREWGNDPQ